MNISVNPRMIRIVPSNAGARIIVNGGKGAAGPASTVPGPAIELQVDSGYIQYRTIGAATWTNLIATATLVGATGTPGTPGTPGAAGADGTDGANGTNGSDGAAGATLEVQIAGGYIQWRVVGAVSWINMIATATLKGDTGAAGTNGTNGTNGTPGAGGADGTNGTDGSNGSNGAAGADGKTWYSCTGGAPSDAVGVNGDYILRTDTSAWYGPKAGGTWVGTGPTSLIGAAGSNGTNGTNGAAGADGTAGADGSNGTNGQNATTFADATARAAAVPAFIGQLGLQLDTLILYRGTATTAGSWAATAASMVGAATAAQGTLAANAIPNATADANSILYAVTDDTPAALALAANQFAARSSAGNIVAKAVTDAALSILDDTTVAAIRATLGAYRLAATTAVGNVSGSVTPDFAASLTSTYTLTGNCTALPAPDNLADGETGLAVFTITGYAMPVGPASGTWKGASWVVTGPTCVRVFYQNIGGVYYISAESPTVVP